MGRRGSLKVMLKSAVRMRMRCDAGWRQKIDQVLACDHPAGFYAMLNGILTAIWGISCHDEEKKSMQIIEKI
jgi:hypothetical protein